MRQAAVGLAILLVASSAGPAAAGMEILAPESARQEVAAAEGVVVVDLFAEW